MHETLSRLENLVQGSIQILDHMKLNSPDDRKLQQMKQVLEQEYDKVRSLSTQTGDVGQSRQTIASMQQKIHELEQMLEPLEGGLQQEYKQDTGNATDQFERRPLEEQKRETETYHSKIDYRSAVKLQDNFNKIGSELLELSGSLEHSALAASADRGVGANATATADFDHDPAPPTISP